MVYSVILSGEMHKSGFFHLVKLNHLLYFVAAVSLMLNVYLFVAPKLVVEFPSFDMEAKVQDITVTAVKGDTISKMLASVGVEKNSIIKINDALKEADSSIHVNIGDKVIIGAVSEDDVKALGTPANIMFSKENKTYNIMFNQATSSYKAFVSEVPMLTQTKLVSGTINGSLFGAARNTGADTSVIMSFINLYGYLVDFQRDIKSGDQFKIYYEYKTDKSGRKTKDAKILYASLTVNGEVKDIYRHELINGKVDYFDSKGSSVRRSLLKTPINGARISSRFGVRHHPVLGYSRMHKGLDYSAPTGTPILAAGDGTISSVKSITRGYGKHITIKHNGTYSTMYAHLSKFGKGIKPGMKVAQGQVIGYVGATGLATGPHLHYEVRENGKQVNPSKISFPKSQPLAGRELARFKQSISMYETVVAEILERKQVQVAKAN
jgi:murein DD-endopeptidase MepM/ murein hydrolase activator NlpD